MRTKYENVFINPDYRDVYYRTPIAFDLDSVLNNIGHDLGRYMADKAGVDFESVRTVDPLGFERFHFSVPDKSNGEVGRIVNDYIMEESPSALATPFIAPVLKYVYKVTGVPISVVTARWNGAVGVTKRWLDEHLDGVPFHAYIVNGSSKIDVLNLMHTRIFVDDRFKTIKDMVGEIEYPVLYTRPWNVGRPVDLGVPRVRDLRDIIPLLNIVARRNIMDWPENLPYPKPNGERITKKYATII
jgi:hypothetical protein